VYIRFKIKKIGEQTANRREEGIAKYKKNNVRWKRRNDSI